MISLSKGFSPYLILAVVIFLFYGNTLANGLVHDDVWQVQKRSISKVFSGCIAEEIVGACGERGFYWRPMQYVSYYLTFLITSAPWVFHLVNLVYFWIAALLVYELVKLLVGPAGRSSRPTSSLLSNLEIKSKKSGVAAGARRGPPTAVTHQYLQIIPLLAAIIFVAHPINSEVVNWVSATPELLMVIFGLLSLIFYLKYINLSYPLFALSSSRMRGSGFSVPLRVNSRESRTGFPIGSRMTLGMSLLFFFLALLSKESAVFLLLVFPASILLSFPPFVRHSREGGNPLRVNSRESNAGFSVKLRMTPILFYLVPLFAYLLLRAEVLGRVVYKYEGYYALNFQEQILTDLALLPKYLLKLVWPLPLSFQPLIQPIRTFDLNVLLGIVVLASMLGLIMFLWVHRFKPILFGLFLIILGILPPLIFVNKLGQFIFSERYLLFSTVGLAIVVAELGMRLLLRLSPDRNDEKTIAVIARSVVTKQSLAGVLVILLLLSWYVIFRRNQAWKDNSASYAAMIRVDPDNSNARFQIGKIYERNGDLEAASAEFRKVIEIDPTTVEAKSELAFLDNVYSVDGSYSFHFPMGWKVSKEKERVITSKAEVNVEITSEIRKSTQSQEQYLAAKKPVGEVVNQGLAQIPGVDLAYVRVYRAKTGQDLDFFLFRGEKVVRIYLTGAGTKEDIGDFNRILGSIRIE